jgi:hypothetical protein
MDSKTHDINYEKVIQKSYRLNVNSERNRILLVMQNTVSTVSIKLRLN